MLAVEVENISKNYENKVALQSVSLKVNKGELFGLIGPDGAGKTTFFRILATLLLPNEGNAKLEGFDSVKDYKKIRNIIGYMPGKFSLYPDLTVEENLSFFATVHNTTIKENYHLIKDIYSQIEPFKDRRAANLSGGMKQKLALSCALIHKPKILLLDEPTTGVDAVSRKEFWLMLHKLKEQGITIIVSTPYMDEAAMCDEIALILEGKILDIDTPNGIVNKFPHAIWAIKSNNMSKLLNDIKMHQNTYNVYPFGQYLHYIPNSSMNNISELLQFLYDNNHKDVDVITTEPTIEDFFIDLIHKQGK